MSKFPTTPTTENNTTSLDIVNGKLIVTSTKVEEYDAATTLLQLKDNLEAQKIQKQQAIVSNDEIIAVLEAQINEIETNL
jgi:hypothetical protein